MGFLKKGKDVAMALTGTAEGLLEVAAMIRQELKRLHVITETRVTTLAEMEFEGLSKV